MAYGIKYSAEYSNKSGDVFKVNILKKDYTGTITLIKDIKNTVSLKYKPKDTEAVVGSELSFSFITKNKDLFSDLFTSEYKDFKAEFYINGLRNWTGWMVSDNLTTSYFDFTYEIDLSFTDGLAELDKFRISNQAYNTIGNNQTLLFYIKNAIKYNDIALNFSVILNTRETSLMPSLSDNTLAVATLPADRFYNIKSGVKEAVKCKDVLNQILNPLNCKIFQANNRYWIVNNMEVDSMVYEYTYVDYTPQYYGTLNKTIDITNSIFSKGNELTKKRPVKSVDVLYKNKYVPTSIFPNNTFTTNDLSFWTFIPVQQGNISVVNEAMHVIASGTNYVDGNILQTGKMQIEQKTNEDKIKISFNVWLKDIVFAASNHFEVTPNLEITLFKPDGSMEHKVWQKIEGTTTKEFEFAIGGTGEYWFNIKDFKTIIPDAPNGMTTDYTYLEYVIDGVLVTPVGSDGDVNTIISYDRLFTVENTLTSAIDTADIEMVVGDGIMKFDVGNFQINGELTRGWKTHGKTENLNLQYINAINYLRLNQRFRNQIRLKLIASVADNISFINHYLFDGKRYISTDFSLDYGTQYTGVDLVLLELPTEEINYKTGVVTLSSVNGEERGSTSSTTETDPTVSGWIKAITNEQILKWDNDKELVLKNGDESKQVRVSLDTNGNVMFDAGLNQNFHFSGDLVAFSGMTPPVASWWNSFPAGDGLVVNADGTISATAQAVPVASPTVSGTIKVGSGLSITNGILTADAQTITVDSALSSTSTNPLQNKIVYDNLATKSNINHNHNSTYLGLTATAADSLKINGYGGLSTGSASSLRVTTANGWVDIGAQNISWCHFNTDRDKFYFNKNLHVAGNIYAGTNYDQLVYHAGNFNNTSVNLVGNNLTLNNGIIELPNTLRLLNSGQAQTLKVGGLTVSNSYNDNAPTNGLFVKNDIITAGKIHTANSTSDVTVDQGGDSTTYYYYLGRVHSGSAHLYAEGILGGHTYGQGKASFTINVSYRDNRFIQSTVQGRLSNSSWIEVYENTTTSNLELYLVTSTWAQANVMTKKIGSAAYINSNPTAVSTIPAGVKVHDLRTDASMYLDGDNTLIAKNININQGTIYRVNSISLGGWDTANLHGIESTNNSGGFADCVSLNSYHDITLRLDSNNNNASSALRIYANTSTYGTECFVVTDTGTVTASGDITAFSDQKLKSNVQKYESGLDKVLKLNPVSYNRIDQNNKYEIGFIAQEVREIEPNLVIGDDTMGETLSLNYAKINVLLVSAIQELKAEIETLKNKLK